MTRPWNATALLILPLCAVALSGCLFSPAPKPDDDDVVVQVFLPQTSPANVLNNLQKAYEEKNLAEYERLFDASEFVFVFAEVDVTNGEDPLPPFWTWNEEYASTESLFEDPLLQGIDLEYEFSAPETPDPDVIADPPPGTVMVYLERLTLVVTKDWKDGSDQDIFIVEGDRHEFFFKTYPDELVEDDGEMKPVVRIVEWRDKALGTGNLVASAEPQD